MQSTTWVAKKHISRMKPGDQPENGRNKASKITLVYKFHNKDLSGNPSLLLHGAEQGASLQLGATCQPGPSPRLAGRQATPRLCLLPAL